MTSRVARLLEAIRSDDSAYVGLPPETPFRDRKVARRVLYGVPHRYRQGDTRDRRNVMGVFLSTEYLTGALLGLISVLGRSPHHHLLHSLTATLVGLLGSWAILKYRFEVSPLGYHVALLMGGLMIGLGVYGSGSLATSQSVMFLLGSGYAFVFFRHWRAILYMLLASMLYVFVQRNLDIDYPVQRAIVLGVASLSLGYSISTVVGREARYRTLAEEKQQNAERENSSRVSEWAFIANVPDGILQEAIDAVSSEDGYDRDRVKTQLEVQTIRFQRVRAAYLNRTTLASSVEMCTLRDLVDGVIERMGCFYEGFSPRFAKSIPSASICIDKEAVSGALCELLDNAWIHGLGATNGIALAATIDREKGFASISVADSGPGLSAKDIDAASQIGWGGETPARGLGIAYARWILQRIGGSLHLEGSDNRGLVAAVYAPISEECIDPVLRPVRILVTEDHDPDWARTKAAIDAWGIDGVETERRKSVSAAQDYLINNGLPDLAMLDLILEDGNGTGVALEIRSMEIDVLSRRCLIVALSSHPRQTSSDVFDQYVDKPAENERLEQVRVAFMTHLGRTS